MQPGPSLDHFVAPSHHVILRPFSVVGASQIASSPGSLSNRRSEEDLPGEGGYLRRQGG